MNPRTLDEAVAVLHLALAKIHEQEQRLARQSIHTDELLREQRHFAELLRGVGKERRATIVVAFVAGAAVGFTTGRLA